MSDADWKLTADARWEERLAIMAAYIRPGDRVLDFGAGAQVLSRYVPDGCSYTAADATDRIPGTIVFDMNSEWQIPGEFDVVVMSGVLEYADNPRQVLKQVASLAPRLVLSYQPRNALLKTGGWPVHLSKAQLGRALKLAGWKTNIHRAPEWWRRQLIIKGERA
jgi:hypothetical protein